MIAYIIRRLLLIIPTLFGIMVINFFIIQIAPGGPVEQVIAELSGTAVDATARISGSQVGETGAVVPCNQHRTRIWTVVRTDDVVERMPVGDF